MSAETAASPRSRDPELLGQTLVVIGGSAGIGLETARRARAEGAALILTGRDPERLQRATSEVGALSTAAFAATDPAALERFFRDLPGPIDHVMVTAGGPHYSPLMEMDFEQARLAISEHILLALWVARNAARKVRPEGTLLFMGGTGGRRVGRGLGLVAAVTAAMPALTASLALELAPIRVNLIAAGFVDTPLSASLLGDGLDARRDQLRATLPHPPRRRTGGRRRSRRTHHDQHRPHGRDLRHRRRAAARRRLASSGPDGGRHEQVSSPTGKAQPVIPTIDHVVDVRPSQCSLEAPPEIAEGERPAFVRQ